MNLIFHIQDRWAEFELGDIKLGLCPTNKPGEVKRSGIVLEVEDIKSFYEMHRENLSFIGEVVEAAHGIMINIQDPGGNIIDLYQPTPDKLKRVVACAQRDAASCCTKNVCCKK